MTAHARKFNRNPAPRRFTVDTSLLKAGAILAGGVVLLVVMMLQ